MHSFETRLWLWALHAPSRLISNSLERNLPDLRPVQDRTEAAPQASPDGDALPPCEYGPSAANL
jgi:hypothetical protein